VRAAAARDPTGAHAADQLGDVARADLAQLDFGFVTPLEHGSQLVGVELVLGGEEEREQRAVEVVLGGDELGIFEPAQLSGFFAAVDQRLDLARLPQLLAHRVGGRGFAQNGLIIALFVALVERQQAHDLAHLPPARGLDDHPVADHQVGEMLAAKVIELAHFVKPDAGDVAGGGPGGVFVDCCHVWSAFPNSRMV